MKENAETKKGKDSKGVSWNSNRASAYRRKSPQGVQTVEIWRAHISRRQFWHTYSHFPNKEEKLRSKWDWMSLKLDQEQHNVPPTAKQQHVVLFFWAFFFCSGGPVASEKNKTIILIWWLQFTLFPKIIQSSLWTYQLIEIIQPDMKPSTTRSYCRIYVAGFI